MTVFSAAALKATPDFEKLLVCDWELARKLEAETWTATGSGSYWLTFVFDAAGLNDFGEVHAVNINASALSERNSVADCDSTASTFYFDLATKKLYVHTADGDSPGAQTGGEYKYCVMAFWYVAITNRAASLRRSREQLKDGKLDRWTDSSTLIQWTKTITGTAALARESSEVYDQWSAYSAKLTVSAAASSVSIWQAFYVRPGKQALLRLKYKCTGATTPKLMVKDPFDTIWLKSDGTWATSETKITLSNSTSWTEYSLTFSGDGAHWYPYLKIYLLAETNGDQCYFDNVELRRYFEPAPALPYLPEGALPNLYLSAGDFVNPDDQLSFGRISMKDDGYFAANYTRFLWNNRRMLVLLGSTATAYEDLAPMFYGATRDPHIVDSKFSVNVEDGRAEFRNLLSTVFDGTTYPNCEANWKEKPIPLLLGDVRGFQPPCSDTTWNGGMFMLTQTSFGGTYNYPLADVSNVWIGGVAKSLPGDWDHNTTFVILVKSPENQAVTAGAQGCFSSYADFLFFMLDRINETNYWAAALDLVNRKGLISLKAKRVLSLNRWYADQISIREVINQFKRSANFFSYTRGNGELFFRVLETGVPAGAQHFTTEDLSDWTIEQDTRKAFASVTVRYRPYNALQNFKTATAGEDRADWEHGVKQDFSLEVLETTDADAELIAAKYAAILKNPPTIVKVTLPAPALFLEPCEKFYITKTVVDAKGAEQTIFSDEVFIVLGVEKDLNSCQAKVTAIRDDPSFYWEETS